MQRIDFRAMNCGIAAVIDTELPAAGELLNCVPSWFAAWEQCLSRFIASSELSQLNAAHNGDWIRVSPILWDVLQRATWAADWSDGLVSALVGTALEAAGYDRSFEVIRSATTTTHAFAPTVTRLCDGTLELDASRQAVRLPPGAKLDLGGVAKGWAAHNTVQRLSEFGPALVDAGGDIAMTARADAETWPIEVAHPHGDSSPELLCVPCGGVATSGRDYRRWRTMNAWQHHLIDVRTGQPAQTDVLSATVIAPDVMMAEAAAKTALILGTGAGMDWLEAHEALAGLLIRGDGRVLHSSRLGGYLWR